LPNQKEPPPAVLRLRHADACNNRFVMRIVGFIVTALGLAQTTACGSSSSDGPASAAAAGSLLGVSLPDTLDCAYGDRP
jgi:hypothetical protein